MSNQRTQGQDDVANRGRTAPFPRGKNLRRTVIIAPLSLEAWTFIDAETHHCPGDEKPYLLEYEFARESVAYGVPYPSVPTWQQIFGSQFPRVPFLALDPVKRRSLLTKAFKGDAGKLPLFDFTRRESGLLFQCEYSLKPGYQDQLEAVHEQTREDPKLTQLQNAYEEAISEFKRNLPKEAYDESIAHVRLTIQFDQTDKKLKEAFAAMLATIRRTKPTSSKHSNLDTKLKRLAATRLYRIFRSTEKARSYAYEQGFASPYKDPGGWSRARTEVWQTLGVDAFPPDDAG